jgi:capsid assembly protease
VNAAFADPTHLRPGPLALHAGHRRWAAQMEARRDALAQNRALLGADAAWLEVAMEWVEEGDWRPWAQHGRAAVIPVQGLIVPECGVINVPWFTGCTELTWQIETALADPDVGGIALWVGSYGGYVAGVDAAAAAIRAAREVKPVAAIVSEAAYSAAYWLASAADTISAARTGGVGHIGVIGEHWDDSKLLENWGINRTVVAEGARKGDRHPSLTDEGLADMRAEIASLRDVFAESVALGRRGKPSVAQVLATESRAYSGPAALQEALSLGLIDAIASPREALAVFTGFLGNPPAPAA